MVLFIFANLLQTTELLNIKFIKLKIKKKSAKGGYQTKFNRINNTIDPNSQNS